MTKKITLLISLFFSLSAFSIDLEGVQLEKKFQFHLDTKIINGVRHIDPTKDWSYLLIDGKKIVFAAQDVFLKESKYEKTIFVKNNKHFLNIKLKKAGRDLFWSSISFRSYSNNKFLHLKGLVKTKSSDKPQKILIGKAQ